MKKRCLWLKLTMKRLLKNPLFVLTLFLIPIIVLGIRFAVGAGDSVLRVAVYTPSTDATSVERLLTEHLIETSGTAITFYEASSEEALRQDVARGNAACGYLFPEHLERKIKEFPDSPQPVAKAVRRKEETQTKIIDELVYSGIYETLSFDLLTGFISGKTGKDHSSELKYAFEKYQTGQAFFEFEYADGSKNAALLTPRENYMILPIRGMTAVLLLLAAMLGTLFWYNDRENRLFARLPLGEQRQIGILSMATPALMAALPGLLSLFLTGISSGVKNEFVLMALYLFDLVAFCQFLCLLLPRQAQMLAAIPILSAGSLILCPVFANLASTFPVFSYIRWLTPVNWYLQSVHSQKGKLLMLALGFSLFLVPALLRQLVGGLRQRRLRKFTSEH